MNDDCRNKRYQETDCKENDENPEVVGIVVDKLGKDYRDQDCHNYPLYIHGDDETIVYDLRINLECLVDPRVSHRHHRLIYGDGFGVRCVRFGAHADS